MLNQSADYALRAALYVAQHGEGRACTAPKMARALGVPQNYLGKVLHALAHAGVLRSVRGPQGGFRLAMRADELSLEDVVGPFQRMPERRVCLLGDRPCDPAQPCRSHRHWEQMSAQLTSFFRNTTIAGMLAGETDAPAGMMTTGQSPEPVRTP